MHKNVIATEPVNKTTVNIVINIDEYIMSNDCRIIFWFSKSETWKNMGKMKKGLDPWNLVSITAF